MSGITFATRLRTARERMGVTQKRLGILIGLTPSIASPRINRYERQSRQPSVNTVVKISKILQVSPSYFYEPDDLIAEIILHLSSLSKVELEKLLSDLTTTSSGEVQQ
ncbi:MAG: helix-turn-helix transcriptional regulator [Magnetococcales bacterium]|nr:helix-turn-helix transcriptional regulator [Magnetococcales bacterium]